jgi:hypothetical protein
MKAMRVIAFVAVALMVPALAWAAPGDGIAGTKHDFSGRGSPASGECTFCHTPHGGLQTLLLWNHKLSTNTFSWDVPSTTAGTLFPTFKGDTYKGPSAKCLSCHDGTVAIGDVNRWNGSTATLDSSKISGTRQIATASGSMAGNHPVAMPYPFGNAKNTYNGSTTGAAAYLDEWQSTPLDPVRVFNDDGSGNIVAGAVPGKTGIECSSCHDPHNKTSTGDLFLRGTLGGNTTAYICLKCHVK